MTSLSVYVESMLNQFVNIKWLANKDELEALAKLIAIVNSEELAHFCGQIHTIHIRMRILCAVPWTPDEITTPKHGKPTRSDPLHPLSPCLYPSKVLSLLCFAAIPRLLHCPLSLSLLSFNKYSVPVRYFP